MLQLCPLVNGTECWQSKTSQWWSMMTATGSMYLYNVQSRAELSCPTNDWETSWRRARLKGLGSEATSFLWKLLHQLLPTEERLARILPNTSPVCKICSTPTHADLIHCFFQCSSQRSIKLPNLQTQLAENVVALQVSQKIFHRNQEYLSGF